MIAVLLSGLILGLPAIGMGHNDPGNAQRQQFLDAIAQGDTAHVSRLWDSEFK